MVLAVVGCREFIDKDFIWKELDELHKVTPIEKVVSGGARGVDRLGIEWAKSRKVKWQVFEPDWSKPTPGVPMKINKFGKEYNPVAGHERNTLIVNSSTHVIAFWDGKSSGTGDTIKKAKTQNKLFKIVNVILPK